MHYAAESGSEEMLRFLLSCGANFRAKDKMGLSPVKLFIKTFSEPPKSLQLTEAQKQHLTTNQLEENRKKIKEAHDLYLKSLKLFQLTKCKTVKFRNKPKNIFYYISRGNTTMAKQMLRLQPLIANAISNHGQSPLYIGIQTMFPEIF